VIASSGLQQAGSFYLPWLAALAAAAGEAPDRAGLFVTFGTLDLPVIRIGLAVFGVVLARIIAPRGAQPPGLLLQVVVTLVLAIAAVAWVVETVPGFLFTFTVAIGLGYSGYTLIALAGERIEAAARRWLDAILGKSE
jgi:hypothetical protein